MKKVIDFLTGCNTSVLATSTNGKPRASIMEHAIVNGVILISTDGNSIKGKNLATNPHISLSAQKLPVYVTVDGTAVPATEAEIAAYHRVLFTNHPEFKEMMDAGMMQNYVYYRIVPETAYLSDMSKGMDVEIIKAQLCTAS
ncbi:MAG: pyridoxamine 5'-phosphate oxidase family protein [Bacteroidales bacterium]|jgi:uncharacterized pyridoxamine 5'-phosphate oxidase family protein|nr:pyridoxamine 5'-phosphate oxidase family protein [Bacteroidales bacterium]